MDLSAIEKIQQDAAKITLIEDADAPVIALPNNMKLASLEQYQHFRNRFTGCMNTTSLMDFINYANRNNAEQLFVNSEEMHAVAFFDLGDSASPGHASHTATFNPKKTAPYSALLRNTNQEKTQKELADWINEWKHSITAIDKNEDEVDLKLSINAIRKITIEAVIKGEHENGDFASSKSMLEKIQVKSDRLPAGFLFRCNPYADISERDFILRMSIISKTDTPRFILRIIQHETHQEEMAQEFKQAFNGELNESTAMYSGSFAI